MRMKIRNEVLGRLGESILSSTALFDDLADTMKNCFFSDNSENSDTSHKIQARKEKKRCSCYRLRSFPHQESVRSGLNTIIWKGCFTCKGSLRGSPRLVDNVLVKGWPEAPQYICICPSSMNHDSLGCVDDPLIAAAGGRNFGSVMV